MKQYLDALPNDSYKRTEIIGDCLLIEADCLSILPHLPKIDACLTDPPYGINQAGGFSGAGGFSKPIERKQYDDNWDKYTPDAITFEIMLSISKEAIIWGGNYFTDKIPQANFWLVWDKENTMPTFSDCELAGTNIDKNSVKRLVYRQNGCMSKEKERFHPTQKAVGVMEWCLSHVKNAETILDPFMGSGTTGVACAKLGRKFIGIELEEKYFDIACKRIEEAYKQPGLFVAPPKTFKQEELL